MQHCPNYFLFWSITPSVFLLDEGQAECLLAEISLWCSDLLMVSGVHYLELLIGQSSGWSRYYRGCGEGVALATILITATTVWWCLASCFRGSDWSQLWLVTLGLKSSASTNIKYSLMYSVYTIYSLYCPVLGCTEYTVTHTSLYYYTSPAILPHHTSNQ